MAFAYTPSRWGKLLLSPRETTELLSESGYLAHLSAHLWMAAQLFVGGTAGFVHAFVAGLVPFAAEETLVQLCTIIEAKRAGGLAALSQEQLRPYAFQPWRWVIYLDGLAHVKFSGGSYYNHGKFACWASGQQYVGVAAGVVHAFVPCLLPGVMEEIAYEMGTLIKHRRMLRNKQKDNTFVNPEKLSDYLGEGYKAKFAQAAKQSAADSDIGSGEGLLGRNQVATQLAAGEKPRFLGNPGSAATGRCRNIK